MKGELSNSYFFSLCICVCKVAHESTFLFEYSAIQDRISGVLGFWGTRLKVAFHSEAINSVYFYMWFREAKDSCIQFHAAQGKNINGLTGLQGDLLSNYRNILSIYSVTCQANHCGWSAGWGKSKVIEEGVVKVPDCKVWIPLNTQSICLSNGQREGQHGH